MRYRGYYYDSETELYYLQSRYYDPATSRFINADSYASTGQDFLGFNMFAYCGNNPVMRMDCSGRFFVEILAVAAVAVVSMIILTACDTDDVLKPIGDAKDAADALSAATKLFLAADAALKVKYVIAAQVYNAASISSYQVDASFTNDLRTREVYTNNIYAVAEMISVREMIGGDIFYELQRKGRRSFQELTEEEVNQFMNKTSIYINKISALYATKYLVEIIKNGVAIIELQLP